MRQRIQNYIQVIYDPVTSFRQLTKRSFESIVADYIILLLVSGLLTALVSLFVFTIKSIYLALIYSADINYARMLNYAFGISTATTFIILFTGTFVMFALALIMHPFLKKLKLVQLLSIMMYSLAPFILFVWIPISKSAFIVWAIVLFIIGLKEYNSNDKKKSFDQR